MTDPDESSETWSLNDHLENGRAIVEALDATDVTDPRVCFHFEPLEMDDSEPWSDEASYNRKAKPLFDALPFDLDVDYVGGTSGIEAWERVTPSVEWLHERVGPFFALAAKAYLRFSGWSFEPLKPRDFDFVSCGPHLRVFNANSPEGRAAINELKANVEKSEIE